MQFKSKRSTRFANSIVKVVSSVLLTAALVFSWGSVQAKEKVKIGFVTFLSGGAAGPFGVPGRNGAEVMISAINSGKLPAPYNTKGLGGAMIEPIIIDEAGNATKQVGEFRKLVQRHKVDVVIGYISSGHCLAIAPVAEELKQLTILFDCGTPRIFEQASYKYVFRTTPTATMDSVGAARYFLDNFPNAESAAGINQNYAWGQDSWRDFKESIVALKPGMTVKTTQFPKIYQGQYSTEISALMVKKADVIHSSFWGGDMEAFALQGGARGIFKRSKVILTTGETALYRLGPQMPEGTIIGARGSNGLFAHEGTFNTWFRTTYFNVYGTMPTYPSYHMVQALLGLKTAMDKAGADASKEQIIKAFEYLEYDTPSGRVQMRNGKGHQAIMETSYGMYKFDTSTGKPSLTNVKRYPAECVNPPDGVKSGDWIKGGFKGARCN